MTLRVSDWQLDSIRNSCDVFYSPSIEIQIDDRFLLPFNARTREHPNHCFLPTFTTLYAEPATSLVYCCYSDHVLHVFASFSKIRVYIFHFVFAYLLCIILYLCFWVCGTLFYGFYSDHALEKLRRGVWIRSQDSRFPDRREERECELEGEAGIFKLYSRSPECLNRQCVRR